MAILLQPDSLSFASNLKKFVISSAEEIRFKLLLGETLLIDESYSPDASGKIEIDVKEVVISQLGFSIPTTDTFEQTSIMKLFTAQIDEAIITFTALRAGVENLSDVPSDFLTDNWLTWQPQTKQTSYNQPEWLTYYSTVPVTIKVKFYLSDNTTQIITLANQAAGKCVTYNMQFARIMSLQAGSKYGYFDVWAENGAGARLNYIQRYIYQDIGILDEFFLAENSLGGIDTVVMSGDSVALPEVENIEALFDEESVQLDGSHTRIFSKNTGWKSKLEAQWLWDFFSSKNRYKLQDGAIKKISIRESDIQNSFQDDLKSFTFKYRLSADKGLLNIPRSADPLPENLEITTPEGLFFLAPRLVEFPSAEFVDEFLLPVQSPYLQEWKKITLGVVKGTILDYIRSQISPGIPQSLLDLSDIDPSLEMANVGAYMVKLASGKWGPGSVSIDLSNYLNKGESDERYSFKSHSHDYVPTATFYSHTGDSVKHTTQEDKDKIIAAYNDKHTHNNKANLDTINQDLSKSSSVEFADLVSAGSVAFYGGTGGGSTPATSLLNLSDIDSSLATAVVGSPLVKLANGKWGPGSVSVDLSNYFTKAESDARFAFKAHSHDYVAPSAFNAHTGDTTKHITSAERAAWNGKESALGNPDTDGKILASTASGVRSWVSRYVLPLATAAMLGGVIIGSNVSVDAQGRISVAAPYSHPASHPASMIDESATRRFLTDTERLNWNDSYDKRHTHGNKANLDSINQNLSQTSNVKFNDIIADGSLAFYGGVGSSSTPVASLLDLSDIDASISTATTGTPLVKLVNGKWGAGSVSIDLSNYYNKSDADARYAFKSHSHDYVTTSVFNGHNHNSLYLGISSSPSSPLGGNFAIGTYNDRNFVQSHSGLPLDINPLGNAVTINGYYPYHSGNITTLRADLSLGSNAYSSIAYLPLGGGTLSGNLIFSGLQDLAWGGGWSNGGAVMVGHAAGLMIYPKGNITSGDLIINGTGYVLHSGNYTSYAAPASGSANYIWNQNSSAQSANIWINGSSRIDADLGLGVAPMTGGSTAKWLTLNGVLGSTYSGGNIYSIGGVAKSYAYVFNDYLTLQTVGAVGVKMEVNGSLGFTLNSNLAATFASSVELANGYLSTSAGSGSAYSSKLSTVYNYPYVDTLIDSIAGVSYEGRITLRTSSYGGALEGRMTIYNNGNIRATDLLINQGSRVDIQSVNNKPLYINDQGTNIYANATYGNFLIGYGTDVGYRFAVNGRGYFAGGGLFTASGTSVYGLQVSGVSGAASTIFLAGQTGFSNGFTIAYNGTVMKYNFADGGVGIGMDDNGYKLAVNGSIYSASTMVASSYIQAAYYKLGSWEIKENASGELEFIQSGVLKFKGTSAGLISQGEVGFYS